MKKILMIICSLFLFSEVNALTNLPVDVLNMDIKSIQDAHSKEMFTYDELVSFYLERIENYDKTYNAIISINDNAIEEAKKIEEEYQKSGPKSDLMGIPFIVKDNIDFVSLPTTVGTKALKDNYPNKNSSVVEELIDLGAIVIAKSNMSEFAFAANSSKSSYGNVKNAYNIEYSPYGSSGGSAVSVALGYAPFALGTDTNASLRTPASANNVVGLRPSFNDLPTNGIVNYDSSRDVVGPIARYVSDAELVYNAIKTKKDKKSELKLRIGIPSSFYKNADSDVKTLFLRAIDILKRDYEIVYLDDFYNSYYDNLVQKSYNGILLCGDFNRYIKNTKSKIKSFQELIDNGGYIQNLKGYNYYCDGSYVNSSGYKEKNKNREEYKKYVLEFFSKNEIDVMIYPTTQNKVLKLSEINNVSLKTNSYKISPAIGYPSMNVSIGEYNNLYYGMEILSQEDDISKIFAIASNFEKKTNYYVVPSEAPNLNNISVEVSTLVNNYNKYCKKWFNKTNEKTKEFFKNYNNNENRDADAKILNDEYKRISILAFNVNFENFTSFKITYLILYFALIIVIYMYIMKRRKKRIKLKHMIYLMIFYVLIVLYFN